MADVEELIVRFTRNLSEDDAREIVTELGAQVRRRMRWDDEEEVMLLVRVAGAAEDLLGKLKAHRSVTHAERNVGGFRPMD